MSSLKISKKFYSKGSKLRPVLVLLGMILLSGCVTTSSELSASRQSPEFPIGGEAVAEELSRLDPEEFPALHDWLDRLAKLADQLSVGE